MQMLAIPLRMLEMSLQGRDLRGGWGAGRRGGSGRYNCQILLEIQEICSEVE